MPGLRHTAKPTQAPYILWSLPGQKRKVGYVVLPLWLSPQLKQSGRAFQPPIRRLYQAISTKEV